MASITKVRELERFLLQEKQARKLAEEKLQSKTEELDILSNHLNQSNRKLKQLLRERDLEMESFISNMTDAYVVMDIDGWVLQMNNASEDLLGFERSEKINLVQIVHPEYRKYTANAFEELTRNGSFANYKALIKTKDGEEKIVQINANIVYDVKGKVKAAQGIVRDITEETKRKEQLREQKKQLDVIVNSSPLGMALIKPGTTQFIKVNKAFCKLLGYTEQEFLDLNIREITHGYDHHMMNGHYERLENNETEDFTVVKQYYTKNKDIIWAKTSVSVVRDERKNIKYQIATIEDITKEIEAKQQLRESENRLASLVKNLQTGVLLEDEHRNVLLANTKCCQLFEMNTTPEKLEGTNLEGSAEDFMNYFKHPDQFMQRMKILLDRKVKVVGEELELADGRIIERNYTPVYTDNVYKGHLWSFNDITLQKSYKENLQAQKEKYSNIIANMNLGLIEISNEGTILLVNQSFLDLSGYQESELLGKSARDLFGYKTNIPGKDLFLNMRDFSSKPIEIRTRTKEGRRKFWMVSGTPHNDMNGVQQGYILIHLDVTAQKNLEFQKERLLMNLERQNEQLNEYAHVVSHDLKSPLRNISTLLEWTKEDFKAQLGEESLRNLDLMQNRVEKMDHLIENILKYSSIDSDLVDNRKVDLNEAVGEVVKMLYVPKHIDICYLKPLPVIKADATRMQQLFQNLIGNAITYIDKEKGKIELDYTKDNTGYTFSIRDNGVGIAKEDFEKIFKIFRHLGSHSKSSGIGLSIVKKIIDLYRGDIWLESTVGQGTIFYFSLKDIIPDK